MKRLPLENAYPPVPDVVHDRIEHTLKEIEHMNVYKKTRPVLRVVLVLAVVVLLLGAAYAATQTKILDFLFQYTDGESNEMLESMAVPLNIVGEDDDIRLTITGALVDNQYVSLTYLIENLKPERDAIIDLANFTANGQQVGVPNDGLENKWLGDLLQSPDYESGLVGTVRLPLSGTVEVVFAINISRLTRPVKIMTDHEEKTAEQWLADGYAPITEGGWFLCSDEFTYNWPSVNNRTGQADITGNISVSFTLPDVTEYIVDATPADVLLTGATVHFERVYFTPLSNQIVLQVSSDTMDHPAIHDALGGGVLPRLVDENGAPLKLNLVSYVGDKEMWGRELEDGTVITQIEISFSPFKKMPKEIHFMWAADTAFAREFEEKVVIIVP